MTLKEFTEAALFYDNCFEDNGNYEFFLSHFAFEIKTNISKEVVVRIDGFTGNVWIRADLLKSEKIKQIQEFNSSRLSNIEIK